MPWKKPVMFKQFDARWPRRMPGDCLCGHPGPPNLHCDWNYLDPLDTGISRSEKISVTEKTMASHSSLLALRFVAGKSPIELPFSQLSTLVFPYLPYLRAVIFQPRPVSKRPAMTCDDRRMESSHLRKFRESKVNPGLTLWWTNIAMENGHRNSGFSHWKWWFSIGYGTVHQRVPSCAPVTDDWIPLWWGSRDKPWIDINPWVIYQTNYRWH